MFPIFNIRDKKELFDETVDYFWKQWGAESNYHFYKDCMEQSCKTDNDVPRFFIAMDNNRIIGSYALLRSDLNSRQDLTPWFACLYVEPDYRGKNIGSLLQKHALEKAKERGYQKLFLCTELTEYYEKTDWKYIGDGYLLNDELTRIYEHKV
jgi:N-acetylglutamate synthase-like GNAT family acetyltransferase